MKDFIYCPMCRSQLVWEQIEDRKRLTCKACGWIDYRNPKPVVACLVLNSKKELLLIKRGVEPCKGSWALPGGFMEIDETLDEAGRRELKEETGLDGEPGRFVGIQIHESSVYGAILTLGVEYKIENEHLRTGDDADDAKFFPEDALPDIPFTSQKVLIKSFLNSP